MFMFEAHKQGMTAGDYVFISLALIPPDKVLLSIFIPPDNVLQPWVVNDGLDDVARTAFFPLFQVVLLVLQLPVWCVAVILDTWVRYLISISLNTLRSVYERLLTGD
jgi:hypothetical protein